MSAERRPRLDSVTKAINEGRYDEDLRAVMEAVDARLEVKRQELLQQVRETFGEGYEIAPAGKEQGAKLNWGYAKTDTYEDRQKLEIPDDLSGENVVRAETPPDEPLTEEFESRSPTFGSLEGEGDNE